MIFTTKKYEVPKKLQFPLTKILVYDKLTQTNSRPNVALVNNKLKKMVKEETTTVKAKFTVAEKKNKEKRKSFLANSLAHKPRFLHKI